MSSLRFPRIKVHGTAHERGRQYGTQAVERIERSVEIYRAIFEHYAGWNWNAVAEHAMTYVPAIEAFRPHFLEEMRGIAEGARLPFSHIVALNVRTEVMFAAIAREAAQTTALHECSAIVALPEATENGHLLVAQNWDWKPDVAETVVILEAKPSEGPRFITAVEAGLLAKTGMNSAGIGLVTNALVTNADNGEPGVPYHAILRAILESETMTDALLSITHLRRASSANYLIAHRDGEAINVEAAPGDYSQVYWDFPEDGLYSHTNHFTSPRFDLKDVEIWSGPGSLFRWRRAISLLRQHQGSCDVATFKGILADHFNRPNSVCSHEDPRLLRIENYASILSIIMDLDTAVLWLADGNPCQAEYHEVVTELY